MESNITVTDPVTVLPQISDRYLALLSKLGINTIHDLVTYFPRYHKDSSDLGTVSTAVPGENLTLVASVESISSIRIKGGRTMQKAVLIDTEGQEIHTTWFNQPFLVKALSQHKQYIFAGKPKEFRGSLSFFPNNFEPIIEGREQVHLGRISPQYKLTGGVSIKWLRNRIKYLLDNLDSLVPEFILELDQFDHHLNDISDLQQRSLDSISGIHFPESHPQLEKSYSHLESQELISLHLRQILEFSTKEEFHAPTIKIDSEFISKFVKELPFELTKDQQSTIASILIDLAKSQPMNRLVQGDVGSGKTIVAVIAALGVVHAGYQSAILAPTTVLAEQHYQGFSKLLKDQGITIELVTGNTKATSADILIGTSAVLARKQDLIKNLGLVVVDEQHKFGVSQREELLAPFKLGTTNFPHFLDMTATPIPRTLALALFSDLSVSTIIEKPAGRLPIKTHLVPEQKRSDSYSWIRNLVKETSQQVYWVCPLVEESDKLEVASAKKIYESLATDIFPDLRIGLMHGKLKPDAKQAVMNQFVNHELDIMVSTSVIEVGVDVPNSTVMVIEGADRFGLAQLHQIRGRVGRSDLQSWCFLFPTTEATPEAVDRLKFFAENNDGLKISEYDLARRGPGEVYGTKQSGIPNLKLASFDNIEQIKHTREIAQKLFERGVTQVPLFPVAITQS